MSKLQERKKHFAATVMIAFLATLVSALGIQEAGRRSMEVNKDGTCHFQEDIAKSKRMLRLELGEAPPIEGQCPAPTILAALDRMLFADDFFLISYSVLNFSFFLFLSSAGTPRPASAWIYAGVALGLTMMAADFLENWYIHQWIVHGGNGQPSPSVFTATAVKWGALAVASALLGLIYLVRPSRPGKLIALPAFAAAALLAAGLARRCVRWIDWGSGALMAVWLLILIHAVIVAIASASLAAQRAHRKGANHA